MPFSISKCPFPFPNISIYDFLNLSFHKIIFKILFYMILRYKYHSNILRCFFYFQLFPFYENMEMKKAKIYNQKVLFRLFLQIYIIT